MALPVIFQAGGGIQSEKSNVGIQEETFADWLELEAKSIYSQKGKALESVDVSWLRKSINTDLSKIKSKVGSKATLLLAIDRKLKRLKELSEKDHKEMSEKVKECIL